MNSEIRQISIIGFGGLAQNILRKLSKQNVYPEIHLSVVVRNPEYYQKAKNLFPRVSILAKIQDLGNINTNSQFHIIIICVPDDQILYVCNNLNELFTDKVLKYTGSYNDTSCAVPFILHTSGSTPMELLENFHFPHVHGVFYPLNTFSRFHESDWNKTPLFLEADHSHKFISQKRLESLLKSLAILFNPDENEIRFISSKDRLALHCGAVFASNFLNFMISQSGKIADGIGLNHKIYLPLINETIQKLNYATPDESQTGPAKRGDLSTIAKHITYLDNNRSEISEIYKLITQIILNAYSKGK